MTPWGYHHHHAAGQPVFVGHGFRRFRGGPSRVVWFVLGAVSAAWWMKRSEMHRAIAYENGEGEGKRYRWCSSTKYEHHHHPRQAEAAPPAEHASSPSPPSQTPAQSQQPQQPPPAQWGPWQSQSAAQMPFGWTDAQWEQEKERMWALGQHAGDRMSDLSEATLDNVLSTVEALKAVSLFPIFPPHPVPTTSPIDVNGTLINSLCGH